MPSDPQSGSVRSSLAARHDVPTAPSGGGDPERGGVSDRGTAPNRGVTSPSPGAGAPSPGTGAFGPDLLRTLGNAFLALLVALLLAPAGLAAQDDGSREDVRMGVGGWEFGVYGGATDFESLATDTLNPIPFGVSKTFGGRVGYVLPNGLFIEGDVSHVDTRGFLALRPLAAGDLEMLRFGGSVGYNVQPISRLQLYPAAGAGAIRWDPEGFDTETDFELNFGGGARFYLTPNVAIRADARTLFAPDPLEDFTRELGTDVAFEEDEGGLWGYRFTGGLSFFIGGPSDSDGDGVRDGRDACPDTSEGVEVDRDGCPLDSDGDGVENYRDACPGTPRGARVDAEGCPLDSDGDGVYDGLDECPNTAAGTEVDEAGCPFNEFQRELEEEGRVILRNIHFEFDEAEIEPTATDNLDQVAQALLANPQMRIEIQGHTDSIASEAYNQQLGERRARAVLNYLTENFPELDRGSFEVRSYGESRPIADNGTPEGQAENRRAEFVVLEGGEGVESSTEEEEGDG